MRREELAGLVHEHRMQLRGQRARRVQGEIVPDRVEHWAQRPGPASLVDPYPRPRHLPGVSNPSIEDRVLAVAVLRRAGNEPQLLRLCDRHRQPQLTHALDVDHQIIDRSGPTRGERTGAA